MKSRCLWIFLTAICLMSCRQEPKKMGHFIAQKESVLCFDDTIKDLGTINKKDQKVATCTFIIQNNGVKNISIDNIGHACSCMSHKISSPIIKIGEKVILTINIDTRRITGRFNKSVFIYTNSGDPYIIRIKGIVQ